MEFGIIVGVHVELYARRFVAVTYEAVIFKVADVIKVRRVFIEPIHTEQSFVICESQPESVESSVH